jgi:hypothetical protein
MIEERMVSSRTENKRLLPHNETEASLPLLIPSPPLCPASISSWAGCRRKASATFW